MGPIVCHIAQQAKAPRSVAGGRLERGTTQMSGRPFDNRPYFLEELGNLSVVRLQDQSNVLVNSNIVSFINNQECSEFGHSLCVKVMSLNINVLTYYIGSYLSSLGYNLEGLLRHDTWNPIQLESPVVSEYSVVYLLTRIRFALLIGGGK